MSENNIFLEKECDVVVIGAGHAGCEAALAASRLGLHTVMFTVSVDSIAMMPCNPNIGGSSKGHLVREIDALGGEMGKNIDHTFIQSKMLNRSKGPAVHSLRAQADKAAYSARMRQIIEGEPNLTVRQMEVAEILTEEADESYTELKTGEETGDLDRPALKKIVGVKTYSGTIYRAKAVVLCTGTYLKARCIYGDVSTYTGPNGLQAANSLSASLIENGIRLRRFKTGTPCRMDGTTIDYSRMQPQYGDDYITPFSFETDPETVQIQQVPCYLTYTNDKTHDVIRQNIDRSPLYSGLIDGIGPRYCPSIEDKVMRFPDRDRHQVFVEPEGLGTNEVYIDGMSSSMPEDVQDAMYHSVAGLENARIVRNAYAIEYDCIDATQLTASLEFKHIQGLFSAGQLNGSSGYEEAAAQGLIAGLNAARKCLGKEAVVIERSEGYIGVLIDDLVTKETLEPYRMMTSRAEYRLLLRQDNADMRLTDKGYEAGLISEERYDRFCRKREQIQQEIDRVKALNISASGDVQEKLVSLGSAPLATGATLSELIRRPELSYEVLKDIDPGRPEISKDVANQVNIEIKYEGYIKRQISQVHQFHKLERKRIPENLDYEAVPSLRIEARQKLMKIRPASIGQASRISGVSPADISVLLVYLESR